MRPLSSWFASRGRLVSLVAGGNALGQLVTLGAAPILARLYSPEAFGEFAVVVSLAAVGAVVAPLALQQAINVPADRVIAAALARLSLRIAAVSTTLGFLATAAWTLLGPGAAYWWLAPVIVGANAAGAVFAVWSN